MSNGPYFEDAINQELAGAIDYLSTVKTEGLKTMDHPLVVTGGAVLAISLAVAAIPTAGTLGLITVTMTIAGGTFMVLFQGTAGVASLMGQPASTGIREAASKVSDLTTPLILVGGVSAMAVFGPEKLEVGMEIGRLLSVVNDLSNVAKAREFGAEERDALYSGLKDLQQLEPGLIFRATTGKDSADTASIEAERGGNRGRGQQQQAAEKFRFEQEQADQQRQQYSDRMRAYSAGLEAERQRESERQQRDSERRQNEERDRFLREEQTRREREAEDRQHAQAAERAARQRIEEADRQARAEAERRRAAEALDRMVEEERLRQAERDRESERQRQAERDQVREQRGNRDPTVFWGGGPGAYGSESKPTKGVPIGPPR